MHRASTKAALAIGVVVARTIPACRISGARQSLKGV
jgi:hypothetical protein